MKIRTVVVSAALLVAGLVTSGCQTGIGRAIGHAFGGTPESVPSSFDLVEESYLHDSNLIIEDVKAGKAETDIGKARQSALLEKLVERQRAVLDALRLLREYQGAESGQVAAAARQAAIENWEEILKIASEHAIR